MEYTPFTIKAHNTPISGGYAQPAEVKAVVVLVHGFGEHLGRYKERVVPNLVASGCAVLLYDNFGHGISGGKRGHCPSYEALLDLLEIVIAKATELYPHQPLILYGHSLGGNLVLNYALRRQTKIKGIIATSPYLRLAFEPPAWKMGLGKLMLKIAPSFTLPSGLDPSGISRDAEEVEKYIKDPLVHDKVSPMFSLPIMEAGSWAIANANKLEAPTLLVHGTADPIIDPQGTQEFHQNSENTLLELFPGAYHELHNDSCREGFFKLILNWLRQQL
ncbi:MAG: lysophospholipase [Flavobacteriaceae bacterium]